ncbi:hypothetical protein ONE63_010729 [Megalurothrips usitatus]|uniref:pectin lyase n=1 Tax=Megalurothrips usitatus TaxID=439358 RepID=A0AAV7XL99_9NEOP|nr:hypothetical protein ONE63_010729 [Megalurothrips usitatus]
MAQHHAAVLFALLAAVGAVLGSGLEGWDPNCISEPVGFGRGTFGGEGGEVVVPKSIKELKNYLKDDVPRVILLNQTFDFVGSEKTVTRDGCFFKKCGPGFQYSLAESDTCVGRERTKVTLDAAGLMPLNVGSYKTIMGVGGRGVLRGKGLKIRKATQVIIRDISIVDINPAVIWGGDALVINGVNQAWIHNVTFKNIGRQFLNSPYCDGKHYWVWLFWGTDDRITLINNRIINTSGRLPHAGGYDQAKSFIHIVGNYFDTNSDVALEPWDGSYLLVEGNRFTGMRSLVNAHATNGHLFLANTAADADECVAAFGEPCLPNQYRRTRAVLRCDQPVLSQALSLSLCPEAVNEARRAVCVPAAPAPSGSSSSSSSSEDDDEAQIFHF